MSGRLVLGLTLIGFGLGMLVGEPFAGAVLGFGAGMVISVLARSGEEELAALGVALAVLGIATALWFPRHMFDTAFQHPYTPVFAVVLALAVALVAAILLAVYVAFRAVRRLLTQ